MYNFRNDKHETIVSWEREVANRSNIYFNLYVSAIDNELILEHLSRKIDKCSMPIEVENV